MFTHVFHVPQVLRGKKKEKKKKKQQQQQNKNKTKTKKQKQTNKNSTGVKIMGRSEDYYYYYYFFFFFFFWRNGKKKVCRFFEVRLGYSKQTFFFCYAISWFTSGTKFSMSLGCDHCSVKSHNCMFICPYIFIA